MRIFTKKLLNLAANVSLFSLFTFVNAAQAQDPYKDPGTFNNPESWRTPEFSKDWGLSAIRAHYAYARGFTGKDIKLGIMDSGTWRDHPEFLQPGKLSGLISKIGNTMIDGTMPPITCPYVNDDASCGEWEIERHGTHVGGTMVAQRDGIGMHGVAFNARLFATTLASNASNALFLKTVPVSIDYLIAQGVYAINNSWGSNPKDYEEICPLGSDITDKSTCYPKFGLPEITKQYIQQQTTNSEERGLLAALERAARSDITMVFAAGNETGSAPNLQAGLPYFRPDPVIENNYLAVVAVEDEKNESRKSYFSSNCSYAKYWCISAPGTDIYSSTVQFTTGDNGEPVLTANYENEKGTSMAAPHVTGALGVVAERYPYMSASQRRATLITTADHLKPGPGVAVERHVNYEGPDGMIESATYKILIPTYAIDHSIKVPDEIFGWGLINLERAMDGPGQFLGNFDITMPEGIYDIWKNDISDEAIKARQAEDGADHDAWQTEKNKRGWAQELPSSANAEDKALYEFREARARAFENRQWFGSLTKRGNGVLTLQGANSYTGPTRVVEGTLDLHGKTGAGSFGQLKGDVIVDTAGRLQGDANLGGNLTVSGTIAPGDTIAIIDNKPVAVTGIGTINVAGNYVQAAGSLYRVDVDPGNTAADHINVAGSATIDSGASVALNKTRDLPFIPGARYTIMTAATVSGAYNPKMITAFLEAKLAYDAQHAYIDIEQTRKFVASGKTPNEIATAAGLQSTRPSNGLNIAFANLSDDITARAALNQLSGEIHASVKSALIEDSWIPREAAFDRLRQSFGSVGAAMRPVADAISEHGFFEGTALWGQILGSRGTNRGDGNAEKITHKTGGFMMGIDKALGSATMPWRAGVMAGYSRSSFDVASGRNSSAKANNYHVGLYAGTQWNNLALRLGGAYSFHKIKTKRSVAFSGYSDYLTGSYKARTLQLFGELGYRIDVSERLSFEPFANIAHIRLHTKAFKETGGLAALSAGKETTKTTFSTLGLRAEMAMGSSENPLKVRLMAGWRHAFGTLKAKSLLAFSSSDAFQIAGAPIAKNAFVGGIGFDMNLSQQVRFSFDYSAQLAKAAHDHRLQGGVQIKF